MSNFSFARPTDVASVQARETIAGNCSACGAEALMRDPVLSGGGWYMVVKCQVCLHSEAREKWDAAWLLA